MNKQDPNEYAVQQVRKFISEDCMQILLMSQNSQTLELRKIAIDAMVDLLCIRYHREAQKYAPGYSLTYDELRKKV